MIFQQIHGAEKTYQQSQGLDIDESWRQEHTRIIHSHTQRLQKGLDKRTVAVARLILSNSQQNNDIETHGPALIRWPWRVRVDTIEIGLKVGPCKDVGCIVGALEELPNDDVEKLSRRETDASMIRGYIKLLLLAGLDKHLLEHGSHSNTITRIMVRGPKDGVVVKLLAERVEGRWSVVSVHRL